MHIIILQHERYYININTLLYFNRADFIILFIKHVKQASIASSHNVGMCIIEPSKHLRIRRSSF